MDGRTLRKLQLIKSVGETEPYRITPLNPAHGAVNTPEVAMAAAVKWADKAGYSILTTDVPREFAPYNAIIRINGSGTEDVNRDYLAQLG